MWKNSDIKLLLSLFLIPGLLVSCGLETANASPSKEQKESFYSQNLEKSLNDTQKTHNNEIEIDKLQDELKNISNELDKLKGSLRVTNNKASIANNNKIEINKLKDELKNISNELNQLKSYFKATNDKFTNSSNELNQLKNSLLILTIILLVLAIIILRLSAEEWKSRRREKLTQQGNETVSSTGNFDTQELIFELDDKVEDIYEKLQKMSKNWNTEWRNLQNKTNHTQENQEVKIPIDNQELTDSLTLQLISEYNKNPHSLLENAMEVSAADRSSVQEVILEKVRRGNYWILNEADIDYMVPKHNIKINEYNSKTVVNLFECQGYQSEYSGFQLIKPAKVSAISKGETWQLVERGILQFD